VESRGSPDGLRCSAGATTLRSSPSTAWRMPLGGHYEKLSNAKSSKRPVVDVAEAVEARSLGDAAGVVQGAAIELDVGEVLEQDVARLDGGTLELLAS